MSLAIVEELASAAAQLRAAMQSAELAGIEKASADFRVAMEAIQAVDAWQTDPALKARVKDIIEELQSSRRLASLLGDLAGQAHAAVATRDMDAPQALYGPR